ncbi:MFS monosaccharide transporter, putative [Talaromyces stipitatus ATCC 10500]|uniref:MFS monosaccharide transporter, putative n=1 Tax=Talaromyces stipitatus (strain ATCC 10500 / CBS 375.48 / QM 6759 / NRRL 1006) TaxID=441959 RepID=B8LTU1_TALSN|nr:MFS monosaccharide transporter, putative [Talaromyces stipitatus ATCC 10500]EED23683.1 MFS monosaccharide transporter, putative [Talaromyces stipitatus ATCC 10500]
MVADREAPTLVVTIVFFVLASVFVALRFVSRLGVVRKVVSHDYLILLAWVIDFGFVFAVCYGTTKGLGLHQKDVPSSSNRALNTSEYVANVLYNPVLMSLKTSILIFYLFLSKTNKIFRWAIFATIFVVNAAGVALTMVNIFQCRPVSAAIWFPSGGNAKCFSIVTIYLSSAPVNIITDIAIFFLPIPILTQLRLPQKQKIILIITFSFGFFTAVVDVIRVAYLQSAATSNAIQEADGTGDGGNSKYHQDFSWYGAYTFMWSAIEINVGIVCACVPSLKPLAARLLPRMIKGSTESSNAHPGSAARPNVARAETAPLAIPHIQNPQPTRMGPRAYTDQGLATAPLPLTAPSEELIEMSDFLGGPGPSQDTESSAATYPSPPLNVSTFFDFVNLKKPKSMLAMSNKESIPPVALTTILFFLWGVGYGFLDILNTQFARITGVSTWGSLGLHAAYYGGYLVSPLAVGQFILKRWGFKATFIAGLIIYACGALIFWPSAVLSSFPPFVISNFIVGCGFGLLETAANPFISLCGPQENAEIRLNLSQAVQATGSILSSVLAERVLFKSVTSVARLVKFQWTYLAIAFFDLLLAAAFYYLPVPEATDEDLQELADQRTDDVSAHVSGLSVIWVTFGLAAFSQFWYVASQEVLVTSFTSYVQAQLPNANSSGLIPYDYLLIGRGIFALGRFITAITNLFFKPRWILLVLYIGLIVFAVLAKELHGMAGVVIGLMLFFFESGVFSITFAISLRGMGRHTKTASAIMATTISGGAFYPFFQEIAQINNNGNVSSSYVVLAVGYAAAAIFPLYLMLVPQAKKQVDPVLNDYLRRRRRSTLRGQPSRRKKHDLGNINENGDGDSNDSPPNTKGEHYSNGGVLSRPRSLMDESPSTVDFGDTARSASGVSVHDLGYESNHA